MSITEEVNIMNRNEFDNFRPDMNSTNEIRGDWPLYQYLQNGGDDEMYSPEFDEIIATAIKYKKINCLRSLEVPKHYFYFACRFDNIDIIEWFMSKYDDLSMNLGLEISCVFGNSDIAKIFLNNGADIHKHDDRYIVLATLNNNYETVKVLTEHGANVNTFNDICFVLACENGNKDIVELLIKRGANIHSSGEYDEKENNKDEGFKLACKNGHIEVISLLLELGIDINSGFNSACIHGDIDIVKSLIDRRANTSNALQYACMSNNIELVKYLMSIGLKLDFENNNELKGAHNKDIINFLLDFGSKPSAKMIGSALYYNDLWIAKLLLQKYTGNETFDDELRLLVSNGKINGLKLLFEYIDIDCTNAYEYAMSINRAYGVGNKEIINLLKEHCAI
jgi:ankyrin repeat protein